MLTIYTGNHYNAVKDITADYTFPENGISPWEQLTWVDEHLVEFKERNVTVVTFSPYIMNYMNLLIIRKDLTDGDINAFERYLDKDDETKEVNEFDLKIYNGKTNEFTCIDTRCLSDTISYIYMLYDKEKIKNNGEEDV